MENKYGQYGLSGNPFLDLSVGENVDLLHVPQKIDESIETLMNDIIRKENKVIIALLGSLGMGKTERIRLFYSKAKNEQLFSVFCESANGTIQTIENIFTQILENTPLTFFGKLNAPDWYKDIKNLSRKLKKEYDSDVIGTTIAEALNANVPSMMFIDNLDSIPIEEEDFFNVFSPLFENINTGVLILFSSEKQNFSKIKKQYSQLTDKINREIQIIPFSNPEADLVIAKRLLIKRIVDDLEALYPFKRAAVANLNTNANGIPSQLLRTAGITLDRAIEKRAVEIDEKLVNEAIKRNENKRLEDILKKSLNTNKRAEVGIKKKIVPQEIQKYSNFKKPFMQDNPAKKKKNDEFTKKRKNHTKITKASITDSHDIIPCPECSSEIKIESTISAFKCINCNFEGIFSIE